MLGLFFIVCLLIWTASIFIYFLIQKLKLTKYYGTVKTVEFFKTSKQYKTFLVIKRKFEENVEKQRPGKVVARFSAILPEMHLKKHSDYKSEIVIEKDGSPVEIRYLDYPIKKLMIQALQDWFPEGNVEVGIKAIEVNDQPSREERKYVLLDINHYSVPYYKKTVSRDDFLLIYCQGTNFSLKVGKTILDNVEAYIKITSNIMNRPKTELNNSGVIKESRLYAYQLKECHENDEEILKLIGQDTYCRNSYIF